MRHVVFVQEYASEQDWLDQLDEALGWFMDAEKRGYPAKELEKLKHRIQRIYLSGETDWQDRYDAT